MARGVGLDLLRARDAAEAKEFGRDNVEAEDVSGDRDVRYVMMMQRSYSAPDFFDVASLGLLAGGNHVTYALILLGLTPKCNTHIITHNQASETSRFGLEQILYIYPFRE